MDSVGVFAPQTAEEARNRYASLEPTAKTVVRELARAMGFDDEEYDQRVTDEVIRTTQETLLASLLEVQVGTREEFEARRADTDHGFVEAGSENVDNVVWHAPPFADVGVAATYQNEREAAVETLRRQAFGRIYQDILNHD